MDICSHPSWQDLGIAHLTLPLLFPISAQPQAVYSNIINTIRPQHGKEIWKTKRNTAQDVTFIQQQNFNGVLAAKQRGREAEEKQGKVLQVNKGTNPIIHQPLEEKHPQLLLHKSRLSIPLIHYMTHN